MQINGVLDWQLDKLSTGHAIYLAASCLQKK